MTVQYIFYIVLGYLSGSLMFGYKIPKYLKGIDIRKVSKDGNPGTANAFIHGGFLCGMLVLICDLLKGFLPVYIAAKQVSIMSVGFALIMAAPVLGHAFPAGKGREEGGKGIATSFGVLLGLLPLKLPVFLLAFFYILFSAVIIVTPHSFRTVITYICWFFSGILCKLDPAISLGNFLISILVLNKHARDFKIEERHIRCVFGRDRI